MMAEGSAPVVFFDLEGTLGSPSLSLPPARLEGLAVYPDVPAGLEQLRARGARLGVIANTGNEPAERVTRVLADAGLDRFLEPGLLIYSSVVGLEKNSPEIFRLAADRAGFAATPEACLFVGEDSRERGYALAAGFRAVPHPRLAGDVLNGDRLRYLRLGVPPDRSEEAWRRILRDLPLVPLQVTGERGTTIYAIATTAAAAQLDDLGFAVDRLGREDDPLATDLYLLRDDRQTRTGFLAPEGQSTRYFAGAQEATWVLSSSREGLYVALPADRSIEDYHFAEARHGHTLKLLPDLSLLSPFGLGPNARPANWLRAPAAEPVLSAEEIGALRAITSDTIQDHVDQYTGRRPLDDGSTIRSRHILSPDNARATQALARTLAKIGGGDFAVRLHRFSHEGRRLDNVEAALRGRESDELVLVTAHLDSTAAFSDGPYDPTRDPAPGADDDASGLAGVLVIAAAIQRLARVKPPRRAIHFVLFNAEESGLIGSQAYAKDQARLGAPIVAVYQMDMIGYNVRPPRDWEIHAGHGPSADVQNRSLALAERLGKLTKQVAAELELPQIYTDPDPAAGRSDHASFHERGYAACAISEDFFGGPGPDSPRPEPNPNYHKATDTFVDAAYAASLARLVAAVAWLTANS